MVSSTGGAARGRGRGLPLSRLPGEGRSHSHGCLLDFHPSPCLNSGGTSSGHLHWLQQRVGAEGSSQSIQFKTFSFQKMAQRHLLNDTRQLAECHTAIQCQETRAPALNVAVPALTSHMRLQSTLDPWKRDGISPSLTVILPPTCITLARTSTLDDRRIHL